MAEKERVCACGEPETEETNEEEQKVGDIIETTIRVNISFALKENLIVKESDKLYEVINPDGTKDYLLAKKKNKRTYYVDCETGKRAKLYGRKSLILVPELGGGWKGYAKHLERIYKKKLSENSRIDNFKVSIG